MKHFILKVEFRPDSCGITESSISAMKSPMISGLPHDDQIAKRKRPGKLTHSRLSASISIRPAVFSFPTCLIRLPSFRKTASQLLFSRSFFGRFCSLCICGCFCFSLGSCDFSLLFGYFFSLCIILCYLVLMTLLGGLLCLVGHA